MILKQEKQGKKKQTQKCSNIYDSTHAQHKTSEDFYILRLNQEEGQDKSPSWTTGGKGHGVIQIRVSLGA